MTVIMHGPDGHAVLAVYGPLATLEVEEMEPNIRYCNYRIQRAGGAVPEDPAELLRLSGGGADQAGLPGLELLQVGGLEHEACGGLDGGLNFVRLSERADWGVDLCRTVPAVEKGAER